MLVSNAEKGDHATAVAELLSWGSEVSIAVAFLKKAGADHIASILKARLASGAETEIFVGTDFFLTEPDALKRLLELKRYGAISISIADRSAATFHPKVYSARDGTVVKTLVGSANLTGGAMGSNEELSLRLDHEVRANPIRGLQRQHCGRAVDARHRSGALRELPRDQPCEIRTAVSDHRRAECAHRGGRPLGRRCVSKLDLLRGEGGQRTVMPNTPRALLRGRSDRELRKVEEGNIISATGPRWASIIGPTEPGLLTYASWTETRSN